jgi:hypothetical protein
MNFYKFQRVSIIFLLSFYKFLIISVFIGIFLNSNIVFASTTDGTIDSTYKYAWGENIGWINFGCSNCNVHITDSTLTGYAWSDNYGWINLNPTTSGVKNNNEGTLSGYAWGEKLGWINFNGATINSSGVFAGSASGDNSGQISFDCTNCSVKTDWRPRSARPACNNAIDDDGDSKIDYPSDPGCSSLEDTDETDPGGGIPIQWHNPPKSPTGGFRILINNGAEYTNSPAAILNLFGGPDTERMAISNFSDFRDAGQETYTSTKTWDLCKGKYDCPEGKYIVYVKFYAPWGKSSEVVSDSIIYRIVKLPPPEVKPPVEKPKKPFIERVPEILKPLIPEILKPKPPEEIKPPEEKPLEITPPTTRPVEEKPIEEKPKVLPKLLNYILNWQEKLINLGEVIGSTFVEFSKNIRNFILKLIR